MQTPPSLASIPYQVHLGCGSNYRDGWLNADADPAVHADLLTSADDLSMLESGSCAVIEACGVLQTMQPDQARQALREWRRLLEPGGTLALQMPDLAACLELIGRAPNQSDLGLRSLFGYAMPTGANHDDATAKWAWTPESLERELRAAGFASVQQVPVNGVDLHSNEPTTMMRLIARAPGTLMTSANTPAAQTTDEPEKAASTTLINIFAWPNYSDAADLDHFLNVFARVLVDRDDACLRLRVDPELDPTRDEVVAAIEQSHARVLGADAALNIALFEGPLTSTEWIEVGRSIDGRIHLDHEFGPRGVANQMDAKVIRDATGLFELVQNAAKQRPNRERIQTPDEVVPEASIEDRIAALQPWRYPVTIENQTVNPVFNSDVDPTVLALRVAARSTLLLQEVFSRVDLRNKSVLNLGSNCGFWSSFYATAGATRVVGVDRELRHVAQAELYWRANRFLPADSYDFLHEDISDASAWEAIRERGLADITLCTGAFHQVDNHTGVLGWMAESTREAIVLDTRVHDGPRGFGAPSVPQKMEVLQTLQALGFKPEILNPGFAEPAGIDPADSYVAGARLVILARRVR